MDSVRGMGAFDFLQTLPRYAESPLSVNRLNIRHEFIVDAFRDDLSGARVLDLASHDGRWSYALSAAGAREVVGVEARGDLIKQFEDYPDDEARSRIRLIEADVFEELPRMADAGERFDVVAIFGLFYHVMDHYRLLKQVHALGPRLVIIDSEFLNRDRPLIKLMLERTGSHLNTIAHTDGQSAAPIGIPSRSAVDMMAETLGYATTWSDWSVVPEDRRRGLKEYFDTDRWKSRDTVALRPSTT